MDIEAQKPLSAIIFDPSVTWKFINDHWGDLGNFHLKSDSTIDGVPQVLEKYWKFEDGMLIALDKDKKPTTKFVHTFKDQNGKWHLEGRFMHHEGGFRNFWIQQ